MCENPLSLPQLLVLSCIAKVHSHVTSTVESISDTAYLPSWLAAAVARFNVALQNSKTDTIRCSCKMMRYNDLLTARVMRCIRSATRCVLSLTQ